MRRFFLLLLAIGLSAQSACAQLSIQEGQAIQWIDGKPAITVTTATGANLKLYIDTGAEKTIFFHSALASFGGELDREAQSEKVRLIDGSLRRFPVLASTSLEIAKQTVTISPLLVTGENLAGFRRAEREVDGIIGMDALINGFIISDKTLRIFQPQKFTRKDIRTPKLQIIINDNELSCMLDTGLAHEAHVLIRGFSDSDDRTLGFQDNTYLARHSPVPNGGPGKLYLTDVHFFEGDKSSQEALIFLETLKRDKPNGLSPCLITASALAGLKFEYNPNNTWAAVSRTDTLRIAYNRSGIAAIAGHEHPEGIIVQSIDPGSPAQKAGIQIGDIIVSINGLPTSNYNPATLKELLYADPGTKILFTIVREGGQSTQVIELVETL